MIKNIMIIIHQIMKIKKPKNIKRERKKIKMIIQNHFLIQIPIQIKKEKNTRKKIKKKKNIILIQIQNLIKNIKTEEKINIKKENNLQVIQMKVKKEKVAFHQKNLIVIHQIKKIIINIKINIGVNLA